MSFVVLRLLLIAFIALALWHYLWRGARPRPPRRPPTRPPAALEEMKQDPVCGTWVPESQALKEAVGGETRYFCSTECRDRFKRARP